MRAIRATLALLALPLAACSLFGDRGAEAGESDAELAGRVAAPAVRSGLAAEADRLLETDRAFASRSIEVGAAEAFRQYFDAEGVQLPAGREPLVGPEAVKLNMAGLGGTILSWEPRYAEVFAPGDWGWTWGEWQAHEPGAGGRRVAQGRYVNIWKKQKDGTWKVRMDMGQTERPPAAAR